MGVFLFANTFVVADFSEGFQSDEDIAVGSLVSVNENNEELVTVANINNASNLIGVAVSRDSSSLYFTSTSDETVAVATTGEASVFVSDLQGPISPGDKISVSPINGVGQKATALGEVVVGVAKSGLGDDNIEQSIDVEFADGVRSVNIGVVRASINVHNYIPDQEERTLLSSIQNTAQAIAGKPVTMAKALISSAILIATLMVVIVTMGSSIQGSMVSLGRNPLAKKTIISSMVKIILFGTLVLGAGGTMAYLILIS